MRKRITLPGCYPFIVEANFKHWHRKATFHGPQSNPKMIDFTYCELPVQSWSFARRLWIYIRGGYACYLEFALDRR